MAPRPVAEASILQAKACGVGRAAQGALWSAAKCKFTSHARKQITRGLPGLIPARQAEGWGLRPRSPDVTPPYHQSHAPEAGGRRCTCHHTCSTRGPYGEPKMCTGWMRPPAGARATRGSCQGPRRAKRGGVGKGGGAGERMAPACNQTRLDTAGSSQPAMAMEAAGARVLRFRPQDSSLGTNRTRMVGNRW